MDETADLTAQLVAIASVNPSLVPGGAGETAAATFVAAWLRERGADVQWLEATPGRPSVVGCFVGSGGGPALLLNGHLDTVTLAGYRGDPLLPAVRDGRMYGRGSFDMKSGVAAMLVAAHRAASGGLRGDVIVACVADEEDASLGTEEVLRATSADAAIVVEPTGCAIDVVHKGFVWGTLTSHGVAAHGSRPDLGVDAIAKIGRALIEIAALDARLRAGPPHPLLGTGSVHASLIAGGAERSSYPASCTVEIERRTMPGEDAATFRAELAAIVAACAAEDPAFSATVAIGLERHPFATPPDALILRTLRTCAAEALDATPREEGVPYWTDAALLAAAGIPTVIFGVAGDGAHAAEEYVELASLALVTDILTTTIRAFCGAAQR